MIEFFTSEDGSEITIKQNGQYRVFTETDKDFIEEMHRRITSDYPEADKALSAIYGKAFQFKFLKVRRFIKCNFSRNDEISDIEESGKFNIEHVRCPMRGECKEDGIICNPKFNSSLSATEIEIVKLICQGFTDSEISDQRFISIHTAKNHRRNIERKTGAHSKPAIVEWAHKNNIV